MRRFGAGAVALAVLLASVPAHAVTLREYFYEFSDRDRAIYMRGLMDLIRGDPNRETEFIACINETGIVRVHDGLTALVRDDPRLLGQQATPWFLFVVGRNCVAGAGTPAAEPTRSEVVPEPEPNREEPAQNAAIELYVDTPRRQPAPPVLTALAAVGSALAAGAGAYLLLRRRSRGVPADAVSPDEAATVTMSEQPAGNAPASDGRG